MMSLALRMGRTLAELEQTMTARELYLWAEFDRISPISDRRGDIQAAQIASAIYQSQGCKVSLSDALLEFGTREESEQGQDEADDEKIKRFFDSLT